MRERPSRLHSLGRIDNDLGYSPENVRWELPIEQGQNRRTPKHNTSGVRGVSWDDAKQRWIAEKVRYGKRKKRVCRSFEEACEVIRNL
jgi:hypothetical protein